MRKRSKWPPVSYMTGFCIIMLFIYNSKSNKWQTFHFGINHLLHPINRTTYNQPTSTQSDKYKGSNFRYEFPTKYYEMILNKKESRNVLSLYKTFLANATVKMSNYKKLSKKCPTSGFMTVDDVGRLGNLMFQYATLYSIARRDHFIPVISSRMHIILNNYFANITFLPFKYFEKTCKFNGLTLYEETYQALRKNGSLPTKNINLGGFLQSLELIDGLKLEILAQFKLKPAYLSAARKRLLDAGENHENVTYVGVHVRRTDYMRYLKEHVKGKPVGLRYLQRAMQVYKESYQNSVFLVMSDDMEWCSFAFDASDDVYLVGNNNLGDPAADLATMSLCNHSIITHGTFGFWGAYLAGGHVLYPTNFSEIKPGLTKQIQSAKLNGWTAVEGFP